MRCSRDTTLSSASSAWPISIGPEVNEIGSFKHKQMGETANHRQTEIQQVLNKFFKPEVTPHLEKWMDDASREEQQVILRLIKIMHDKQKNDPRQKLEPIKSGHLAKIEKEGHLTPFPDKKQKESPTERLQTVQGPRRVYWAQRNQTPESSHSRRPFTATAVTMAELRAEFDICPDWRAPLRRVVPMTQVPYRSSRKKLLSTGEAGRVNFKPLRSEFTIHPEWSTP